MGTFIRDSAVKLFVTGLRKVLMDQFASYTWKYKNYLYTANSSKKSEEDYSMFGIFSVPMMNEEGEFEFVDPQTGYSKTYTHNTYGVGMKWSKEADEDELYGFFSKFPSFINKATRYTIEAAAADVLNDGFTTNGPDGVPLFSLLHPARDGYQTNTPSTQVDLGLTSLENAMVWISKQKTHEGHPIDDTSKKKLIIPPALKPMAKKLILTEGQPFSANNTINYVKGEFDIDVNPYLTSESAWFVIDEPRDGGLMWFWRVNPYVWQDVDENTLAKRIRVRMRFSNGHTDWRGHYASSGA